MSLGLLFLVGQSLAGLPALPNGTEVRLVSPDLLTVYASARLDGGTLTFVGAPPPGTELRILIFPPEADAVAKAAALSGARALLGHVSASGDDIVLVPPDGGPSRSLHDLLMQEQGVELHLEAGKEAP